MSDRRGYARGESDGYFFMKENDVIIETDLSVVRFVATATDTSESR